MSKIATREAYGKALAEFGKDPISWYWMRIYQIHKNRYLSKVYPERFLI